MLYGKEIIVVLAGYGLGTINTGYYLVRLRTGRDIRRVGSGSTGSSNVSRTLGTLGFLITFTGDTAKGAIATAAALLLGLGSWGMALVMIAVVAGHIWPVQLGFRGGKGLATALGAALIFDCWLVLLVLSLAAMIFVLIRERTLSIMVPIALSPGIAAIMGRPPAVLTGASVIALLVVFTHKANIRDAIRGFRRTPGQ